MNSETYNEIIIIDIDNCKHISFFVANRFYTQFEILEHFRYYNGFIVKDMYIPDSTIHIVKVKSVYNERKLNNE